MFKALVEFIQGGQYDDRPNHDFVFIFNMNGEITRAWGPYNIRDINVTMDADGNPHMIQTIDGHRFYDGEGVVGWFYWIAGTELDTNVTTRILIPNRG